MIESIFDFFESVKLDKSVSIGDIFAFITILIGIYQFNKQAKINRKERDMAQKETWFLEVIVEPQLSSIDQPYQELIDNITKQRKDLASSRPRINDQNFLNKVSKYKRENNVLIARKFNHLEALVRSYSIVLSSTLGKYVILLQDINVRLIDNYNDNLNPEAIQIKILKHEQAVLALLNKGLSINRF